MQEDPQEKQEGEQRHTESPFPVSQLSSSLSHTLCISHYSTIDTQTQSYSPTPRTDAYDTVTLPETRPTQSSNLKDRCECVKLYQGVKM